MTNPDQRQSKIRGGTSGDPAAAALQKQYLSNILAGRRKDALDIIMDAYRGGYPIPGIYMDIFQESLYEIGRLWETNRITVADEHLGTAITQYVMSNLYQHLEIADEKKGRLVITGVQGELHQVGANMVADILESDGWDVVFLGTNVPADGVINSINQHKAILFGISSTMLFNIPKVIQLKEAVQKEFGDTVSFMLGGGAFSSLEKLPEELDGCLVAHNLRDALELTRGFSSQTGKRRP